MEQQATLEELIHDMDEAVLETEASGRPVAHLWDKWDALRKMLERDGDERNG